jgi:uroporphyrinogen-III synthase
MADRLNGYRILILETREEAQFSRLLGEQGADVLQCPMFTIHDAPDPVPIEAWIRRFVDKPFDDLVLMTGEGLRRLRGAAERAGLEAGFRAAIARMRTITRGPKPARALREIGFHPALRAATPTTDGIIAALSLEDLSGRRVGIQLPPDSLSRLADFLRQAGALPDPVVPYVYVPRADSREIAGLIDEMAGGRIDMIAFTSAPQVARLFEAAAADGRADQLLAALRTTPIAAIGPVVAGELQRHGLGAAIMPQDSFFMKPLVSAIAAALSR